MNSESVDSSSQASAQASSTESPATSLNSLSPPKASNTEQSANTASKHDDTAGESPPSGMSPHGRTSDLPQPIQPSVDSPTASFGFSTSSRLTSGLGLHFPSMASGQNESSQGNVTSPTAGVLESLTKNLVDSSRSAVKAMQVRARHAVSQNNRR